MCSVSYENWQYISKIQEKVWPLILSLCRKNYQTSKIVKTKNIKTSKDANQQNMQCYRSKKMDSYSITLLFYQDKPNYQNICNFAKTKNLPQLNTQLVYHYNQTCIQGGGVKRVIPHLSYGLDRDSSNCYKSLTQLRRRCSLHS